MNSVTNSQLELMFASLVKEYQARDVDTSGWAFGQHVGMSYYIARIDKAEHNRPWQVSPMWRNKREAYDGMLTMLSAILIIPQSQKG